jgi:hypothetical protein
VDVAARFALSIFYVVPVRYSTNLDPEEASITGFSGRDLSDLAALCLFVSRYECY